MVMCIKNYILVVTLLSITLLHTRVDALTCANL
jgi:hypothetical protein